MVDGEIKPQKHKSFIIIHTTPTGVGVILTADGMVLIGAGVLALATVGATIVAILITVGDGVIPTLVAITVTMVGAIRIICNEMFQETILTERFLHVLCLEQVCLILTVET